MENWLLFKTMRCGSANHMYFIAATTDTDIALTPKRGEIEAIKQTKKE